jgi:putative mRNA 3-end processing factor
LFAYALGKAQRIAAQVDAGIGPIFTHGAVDQMLRIYRDSAVLLNPTWPVLDTQSRQDFSGALVIAPPSAMGSPWMRRFSGADRAFASGWMQIRGNRRRRGVDRGFVISDHADWKGLLDTIEYSRAQKVWVTHGFEEEMVRFLRERGLPAEGMRSTLNAEVGL